MCVLEELGVLVKDLQQFLGTFTDKLKFSPHQIAWHVQHPKNSFILAEARGPRTANRFQMFRGSRIRELEACGLSLEACCLGLEACGLLLAELGA